MATQRDGAYIAKKIRCPGGLPTRNVPRLGATATRSDFKMRMPRHEVDNTTNIFQDPPPGLPPRYLGTYVIGGLTWLAYLIACEIG